MKGSINYNPVSWFKARTELDPDDEDQTPIEDRIPTSWWTTGLFLSTVTCCAILATQFHMNVGEAILSLLLGFIFSFIGVQSAGHTDVNPVSTVAKVGFSSVYYHNYVLTAKPRLPNLSLVVSPKGPAFPRTPPACSTCLPVSSQQDLLHKHVI
jgi:hypothetical protein